MSESDINAITAALIHLGCPPHKAPDMASQLDKRARQLAEERKQSYETSLAHLLRLMAGGWNSPIKS